MLGKLETQVGDRLRKYLENSGEYSNYLIYVIPNGCSDNFTRWQRDYLKKLTFFLSRMRVAFITHSFFTGAPGFSQYFVALSETLERDPDRQMYSEFQTRVTAVWEITFYCTVNN